MPPMLMLLFFLNVAPLIRQRWTNRYADCCVNAIAEKVFTATNLVNFGLVTPEILWLSHLHILVTDCRAANIHAVLRL